VNWERSVSLADRTSVGRKDRVLQSVSNAPAKSDLLPSARGNESRSLRRGSGILLTSSGLLSAVLSLLQNLLHHVSSRAYSRRPSRTIVRERSENPLAHHRREICPSARSPLRQLAPIAIIIKKSQSYIQKPYPLRYWYNLSSERSFSLSLSLSPSLFLLFVLFFLFLAKKVDVYQRRYHRCK